jgi:transcriptional regulator GlxA family with amidase domain
MIRQRDRDPALTLVSSATTPEVPGLDHAERSAIGPWSQADPGGVRPKTDCLSGALRAQCNAMFQARSPSRRHRLRTIATMARMQLYLSRRKGDTPMLREMAAMASMSRSHFSRTFHAVTGVTVREFVASLRLDRASVLLRDSTLSLTTIALECGFYDLPHFDKAFRRRFGMPPREFRGRSSVRKTG